MQRMFEGLFDKPVKSPYFRSLARQARLCPRCGAKTRLAGTLNPDAAYEVCDRCGLFTTLVAPEWACVGAQDEPPQSRECTLLSPPPHRKHAIPGFDGAAAAVLSTKPQVTNSLNK